MCLGTCCVPWDAEGQGALSAASGTPTPMSPESQASVSGSPQKDEENRRLEEKRRVEEERQRLEQEQRERELQEAAGREQMFKARSSEIEAQK